MDALPTKASTYATLNAMAGRCVLGHAFQQWMMAFAATVDFREPTPQMLEMVSAFCQSWLQSRINEQGNKELRDGEHRVNASKVGPPAFYIPWGRLLRSISYTYTPSAQVGPKSVLSQSGVV